MREELSTARRLIERLQREISEQSSENLGEQVRSIVGRIGGGSQPQLAEHIARLEIENRQLRNKNRALRVTSVWQRLMALRQGEARRALERQVGHGKDALESTRMHLRDTQAALEATTPGATLFGTSPMGFGGFSGDPSPAAGGTMRKRLLTVANDKIVRGGAPTPGGGGGGGGDGQLGVSFLSPLSARLGRRMGMATLSVEARNYARFHEIATSRKLALASRGYEAENVFIDELYDAVKSEGVPPEGWHDFLRQEIPSPTPGQESGALGGGGGGGGDAAARGSKRVKGGGGGARRGKTSDPSAATATAAGAGGIRKSGEPSARARLRRVNMPFASSESGVYEGAGSRCTVGQLMSASQLLARSDGVSGAVAMDALDSTLHLDLSEAVGVGGARAGGGRAQQEQSRRTPGRRHRSVELGERTQAAATIQPPNRKGAPTQLTFREGYEDWRHGMDLMLFNDERDSSVYHVVEAAVADAANPGPGRRAAPPMKPPMDPMMALDRNLKIALRHGEARADSAYALVTSASVNAAAAEVRAAPARRATDEAAKASLRAAAASEAARNAAIMAAASRSQATGAQNMRPTPLPVMGNAAYLVKDFNPEAAAAGHRSQVRLLPE